MDFILRWLITACAVWVAVRFIPGIDIEDGVFPLLAVSLILGGVNAIIRPVLNFLACGIIFLTLGLFLLVINAAMLLLSASIAQAVGISFVVDGFWPALFGSLVISLISAFATSIFLGDEKGSR